MRRRKTNKYNEIPTLGVFPCQPGHCPVAVVPQACQQTKVNHRLEAISYGSHFPTVMFFISSTPSKQTNRDSKRLKTLLFEHNKRQH